MAEITKQVGQSSDDCQRVLSSDYFNLTMGSLYAGSHSSVWQCGGGMRFTSIAIPQGSTIDQAYLTLRCDYLTSTEVVKTRISAEDIDNALTFADNKAAFDARWANRTAHRVDWDNIPAWTQNLDYDSPEIKSVIQEIVDRAGWVSENDIVIFWEDFDDRSDRSSYCYREAYSYNGSTEFAPKLYIKYTPPVVGWTGKISGVTNPAKIMGVDVANIKSVKGVE